ncbi:hypothetical protein K458DRAFT_392575 [Lentithecium fluviatile CBS 122367]|uniref:Uncharacterized protein n=1 Tax=Lentithecium fluviatile CBS 122367 TaxID=1168545 RepID=A0A6G1ISF6_9PLEO|nr:hypothetical protein K458DRAFT_392575 [Lentithecium fluviatile CBS 122367]
MSALSWLDQKRRASNNLAQRQQLFLFLEAILNRLPRELRDQIYEYLVKQHPTHPLSSEGFSFDNECCELYGSQEMSGQMVAEFGEAFARNGHCVLQDVFDLNKLLEREKNDWASTDIVPPPDVVTLDIDKLKRRGQDIQIPAKRPRRKKGNRGAVMYAILKNCLAPLLDLPQAHRLQLTLIVLSYSDDPHAEAVLGSIEAIYNTLEEKGAKVTAKFCSGKEIERVYFDEQ